MEKGEVIQKGLEKFSDYLLGVYVGDEKGSTDKWWISGVVWTQLGRRWTTTSNWVLTSP